MRKDSSAVSFQYGREKGEEQVRQSALKSEILEWLRTIVIGGACAAFVILFIAQSYVVEGSSMDPNMRDRDRLLVEKVSYRLHEPRRGDVVVFRTDDQEVLIKRVIAVPGDTVLIKDHGVYVNGMRLEEEYINGRMIAYTQIGPLTVPDEHYFVLGDNRNVSRDSRDPTLGFVEADAIVGRALFRYWPLTRIGVVQAYRAYEG